MGGCLAHGREYESSVGFELSKVCRRDIHLISLIPLNSTQKGVTPETRGGYGQRGTRFPEEGYSLVITRIDYPRC